MEKEDKNSLAASARYIDPTCMDYLNYFDHLIAYNRTFQRKVGKALKHIPYSKQGNHVFMTVGSDSRLEKGPVSGIEIVLLANSEGVSKEIGEKLNEFMDMVEDQKLFDRDVEIRYPYDPSSQWILNRAEPTEKVITSLNRVYDAVKLAGDSSLVRNFKGGLFTELIAPDGKKLLEVVENKAREHKKIAATGIQTYKGEQIQHYDLTAGVTHYEPRTGLCSFKQGPLRAIQFALVRDQSRAIRSGIDPDLFFETPENTVEKLNSLEVQGLSNLSMEETRELCDQYKYFMWLYHISQTKHNAGIKTTGFDVKQTAERIGGLTKLLSEKRLIKKKEELTFHGISLA